MIASRYRSRSDFDPAPPRIVPKDKIETSSTINHAFNGTVTYWGGLSASKYQSKSDYDSAPPQSFSKERVEASSISNINAFIARLPSYRVDSGINRVQRFLRPIADQKILTLGDLHSSGKETILVKAEFCYESASEPGA